MGFDTRKPNIVVSEQQKRRSACPDAQSDQRLPYSLSGKYHDNTCYTKNLGSLSFSVAVQPG